MSTIDSKLNFRPSPSTNKTSNLNANNGTRTINSSTTSANALTDGNGDDMSQTNGGKHANEFPFGEITFRFDELTNGNGHGHSSNQSSINNHNHINGNDYKLLRSNGNAVPATTQYSSQRVHDHSTQMPAAIVAMNNAIAQLSPTHEYENVNDNDVTDSNANSSYQSLNSKPVHSDAKSVFFGLKTPSSDDDGYDGELMTNADVEDHKPLLVDTMNAVIKMPAQYQNVPNNSVCFIENTKRSDGDTETDADECSECGKMRCDKLCNGKWESEQYCRCNNSGIDASPTSTSAGGTTFSSAGIDSPTSTTSMKSAKPITLDNSTSFRKSQSLSQAVYMSTTVPQNIKGTNIMGSHTPTRNSLRHSRMIVVNKNYQVPRRRNPLNIRHPGFARIVYVFHILVGLVVACLGLWLCWWAPSTTARENPYWSGLTLMLSGILGMIVIGFKRIPRHKLRQHLFTFLRINSTFVTFVAALCTLVACTFAIMHLTYIFSPNLLCRSVNGFDNNDECTCLFNNAENNSTATMMTVSLSEHGKITGDLYYRDMSCKEVLGPFKYILIASSIFNFTGFLLCCILLILLCVRQKRVKRVPYCAATSRNRL